MSHIASFISSPIAPSLDDALLARASSSLPQAQPWVWLAAGIAADIPFHAGAEDLPALADALRSELRGHPIDVNLLPASGRRKRLLLADMDSTMIEQECVDELADLLGLKEKVAAITERAMQGELAFEPALRERVALLKGITLTQIEDLIRARITLMPGAETLIATMRASGAHTVLVSGGFTLFTEPVAARIGFHEHHSNTLDLDGDRLLGTVREPILGRAAKRQTLIDLRAQLGLAAGDIMAVGDGANDLDMLNEAGLGVAFRAKPAVAAAARARIDHGDLTALLYLQGYEREAFL